MEDEKVLTMPARSLTLTSRLNKALAGLRKVLEQIPSNPLLHFIYPDIFTKPFPASEEAVILRSENYSEISQFNPLLRYALVSDSDDLTGAWVLFLKDKKLQGSMPWGQPILGKVQKIGDHCAVYVDPIQFAILNRNHDRQIAAINEQKDIVQLEADETNTAVKDWAATYKGDPLAMTLDGHYLGDDGFIVPKNFDEFYDRYPKYVINWVKKRLNKFSIDDDVEDWAQDLLIHMKFLPQGSKYRLPGANERELGCTDIIETFNPYQQYGASEKRFRNYINFCLANRFNTLYNKRVKNPLCRPGNVSFQGETKNENYDTLHTDEYVHSNSDYLADLSARKEKQQDDRLFTEQFKCYVKKEDPSVYPAIEALEATGRLGEAAEYLGITEGEFSRYRVRLRQLGENFVLTAQKPKPRRKYRKRINIVTRRSDELNKTSSNIPEDQNAEERESQLGQI